MHPLPMFSGPNAMFGCAPCTAALENSKTTVGPVALPKDSYLNFYRDLILIHF